MDVIQMFFEIQKNDEKIIEQLSSFESLKRPPQYGTLIENCFKMQKIVY